MVMLNPARQAGPHGPAGKGEQRSSSRRGPLAKIALITGITGQGSLCLAKFATGCHTSHLRLPARGFGGA